MPRHEMSKANARRLADWRMKWLQTQGRVPAWRRHERQRIEGLQFPVRFGGHGWLKTWMEE